MKERKGRYIHRNKSWIKGETGFIELRNRKEEITGVAMVDRNDLIRCLKVKWYLNHTSSRPVVKSNKTRSTLSRYILRLEVDVSGKTPLCRRHYAEKLFVQHRDNDIMNCKRSNLIVTLGNTLG